MYIYYNPNPAGNLVGDCVIRAICKATGKTWDETFEGLVTKSHALKDMPSSNYVWAAYLRDLGFHKYIIPDICPVCYTIKEFGLDHPHGTYILGTGTHVVTVEDGDYYDAWDSGNEVPMYYFERS